MGKYHFKITQYNSNFQYVDDWEEWISDESFYLAKDVIERVYPENEGYKCTLINENE